MCVRLQVMRQVLVFALIAILLITPVMVVLVAVAGLTPGDTSVAKVDEPSHIAATSVALRALSLLRAPPI